MGGTTTATRTANCKLAKYPSSIYTEGLTDRRRRRRNPPAMTRPDPNKIKLAGSGTSDKKYTSSVATIDPVESTQLIVPASCFSPVSNLSHDTGIVIVPMTTLVPQFAKGGSPAAPGGSERKVMFAVFERNVLPVIPKIPRASLKVLPPRLRDTESP